MKCVLKFVEWDVLLLHSHSGIQAGSKPSSWICSFWSQPGVAISVSQKRTGSKEECVGGPFLYSSSFCWPKLNLIAIANRERSWVRPPLLMKKKEEDSKQYLKTPIHKRLKLSVREHCSSVLVSVTSQSDLMSPIGSEFTLSFKIWYFPSLPISQFSISLICTVHCGQGPFSNP